MDMRFETYNKKALKVVGGLDEDEMFREIVSKTLELIQDYVSQKPRHDPNFMKHAIN